MSKRRKRELSVPEQHAMRIARETMRMHCIGARILGGPDHVDAARHLGRSVPDGCNCAERREQALAAARDDS